MVLAALLLTAAGCFGFQSTPGLLDLRRTPETKTFAQIRRDPWSFGSVVEIPPVTLETIPLKPGYHLAWLKDASGDETSSGAEILLWSSKAPSTSSSSERRGLVLRRLDPHELLTAQKELLETIRPSSSWRELILVEPFEVAVIPAALITSLGLLLAGFAARRARHLWLEIRTQKNAPQNALGRFGGRGE